ncbi:MAG: VCBS repeat-containing protein [Myxococcales bacterium]|nr:VCBS repeat-containing protein [Myxococcales bacterium]MDD9971508.1 VCBS repeat-containing protein [Myxococcales bacterium]
MAPTESNSEERGGSPMVDWSTNPRSPIASRAEPDPASLAPPKHLITVRSEPGAVLIAQSIVGDLDGDGIGDLVLLGVELPERSLGFRRDGSLDIDDLATTAHVFYGRTDMPATLRAADSDARVRGHGFGLLIATPGAHPIGDLNGDGLADLVLTKPDEAYFLFGDEARLSGDVDVEHVTARWSFDTDPPKRKLAVVIAAGDVQNDGLSDVVLVFDPAEPHPGAPAPVSLLFTGRTERWPERFGEASATATFSAPDSVHGARALDAGDLDGDGRSDLLFNLNGLPRLVLGSRRDLMGVVDVGGAETVSSEPLDLRLVDDLNGDGVDEFVWRSGGNSISLQYGAAATPSVHPDAPDLVVTGSGISLTSLTPSDFDGDGQADLIVSTSPGPNSPGGLYVVTEGQLRTSTRIDVDEEVPLLPWNDMRLAHEGRVFAANFVASVGAGADITGDGVHDVVAVIASSDPESIIESRVMIIPGGYEQ